MSANRKRSYDAAFKLAAVEDAEKTTNRDIELGTKFFIIHIIYAVIIFCRRPRIIATSFSRTKKLVAAAFDRGNTVIYEVIYDVIYEVIIIKSRALIEPF